MNLVVTVPPSWAQERRYIWRVLLNEFLGLSCDFDETGGHETTITVAGSRGAITIPEGFFGMNAREWLLPLSMPAGPIARLSALVGMDLPARMPSDVVAIYGANPGVSAGCSLGDGTARINFDIAGSAFFMLTRYEEAVVPDRDRHDRFPARASLAYKEGFLGRPVVNEYVEMLFRCLRHCWPGIGRRARGYRVVVSHDIDSALFNLRRSPRKLLRAIAGDLVQRRDSSLAIRRARSYSEAARGMHTLDPHNTFDYLMDVSEKYSLRSAFYFIADGKSSYDADYTMDVPWIGSTVQRIGERGHEVGLHPGYDTYLDADLLGRQFRALRGCAERHGIRQTHWGGRQHYLRWRAGSTWANWARVGLDYDSSVGFAEMTGFRAGCCLEYPVYDVVGRRALALRERPLILMETTLIAPAYMNLSPEDRLEEASRLATVCKTYGGDMTLLWHNSKVASRQEREEYESILELTLSP